MGQASSSSSSSSAIDASGAGNIGAPSQNLVAWIVGGVIVLVLAWLWVKKGKS